MYFKNVLLNFDSYKVEKAILGAGQIYAEFAIPVNYFLYYDVFAMVILRLYTFTSDLCPFFTQLTKENRLNRLHIF